jgi:hypothetical protein
MAKKAVDENGFTVAGEIEIAYGNFWCTMLILPCRMEIELKRASTKCRILAVVR